MVNIERLKSTIKDRGMTITAVARKAGVDRVTLYNRFNGKGEFTVSEIEAISDALFLVPQDRDAIFFPSMVEPQ